MTDHGSSPRFSRMADQPAPTPTRPLPEVGPRPSFEELMAQSDTRDYRPLADLLGEEVRSELGLQAGEGPLPLGRDDVERVRDYLLAHPALIEGLPDDVRDLINL
ncbi:hypothetical protein [Streptomyces sp. NBC_01304]|uniref:hypothetical protein n=1 Tax=Streptomyces sp. NBC_01304 TaxID=2903818 RepID=UPI002E0E9B84|nr:hypothetical protein OG430_48535 [Streptomyces sp. NBC_01304]